MWRRVRILAFTVAAVMAVTASTVAADGKFFGRASVARDPAMPSQRAILAWHDGIQTLIVESAFDARESASNAEFAWVVPLPARPSEIAATTTNALTTLDAKLTPKIERTQVARASLRYATLVLTIALLFLIAARWRRWRAIEVLVALIAILVVAALFLPALARARSIPAAKGIATDIGRVGSYHVHVLDGDGAGVVAWLTEHGFHHDDEARRVISEYVNEEWVFAAMRISSDSTAIVAPHPLRFVCPTPEPIYPMRLTGVGQSLLALDLYVIAARGAEAAHCVAWTRASFRHDSADESLRGERATIASPELVALAATFPDGSLTITRLHGRLDREAMRADIRPLLGFDEPVVATVWEQGAPVRAAFARLFYVLAAGALVLTIPVVWTAAKSRVRVVAVGALTVAAFIVAPSLAQETISISSDRTWFHRARAVRDLVRVVSSDKSLAEIRAELAEPWIRDYLTEDSDDPFGYRLASTTDGAWTLNVVDETGRVLVLRSAPSLHN